MVAWYRNNQPRLSYLKMSYLEDPTLYNDGGGQEKRNFKNHLLLKIIKQKVTKEMTFRKVHDQLKSLKTAKGGWLSQVLSLTE